MKDRNIGKVLCSWTGERTHHNYDTCFIVEAEITKISLKGRDINSESQHLENRHRIDGIGA